jgi:predicted flap endonuclease-1-like 5' DNA nuclease
MPRRPAVPGQQADVNGLTLLALIAVAVGVLIAYRVGVMHGRREPRIVASPLSSPAAVSPPVAEAIAQAAIAASPARSSADADPSTIEHARRIESLEQETSVLRGMVRARDAEAAQLREFADERRRMFGALADSRGETARYRQIVVDIETDAPPPLLDVPGAPDDLKLIVGVGPVLERMLHQLGVVSYRQIAHWSEHDIDTIDARLTEFPGRIRRDAWVTQARELHLSKYGERP